MHALYNILILAVFVWCVSTANILLVPGIGGSMLYSEDKLASSQQNRYQHIWPVAISQDSLLRRAISRQVFPNGTYVLDRYEVNVPQSSYGLGAMYDLNPDLLIYKTATYYMKTLIDMLHGQNFTVGVDLFGFPYDWRYPVNYRPHLDSLEKIFDSKPNEEWFVIAHSMGGLIMQEYFKLGSVNNRNDSHITLITVGTPFHGVGGRSLQAFTTGYNFGNPQLSNSVAKEFTMETFSAYDLLPQPQLQPRPTVDFKDYYNEIAVGEFHPERVRARECFTRPKSYYVYNSGVATPHDIITTKASDRENDYAETFIDGDGTVPSSSATNHGCHTERPINLMVNADHMDMLNHVRFLGLVYWIINSKCPDVSGYYRCTDDSIVHVEQTVPTMDFFRGWYVYGKNGSTAMQEIYYLADEPCGAYIAKSETDAYCYKRGTAKLTGVFPSFKNLTKNIECPKDYVLVDGFCLRNVTTVVYQCGEGSQLIDGKCTAPVLKEEKEAASILTIGLAIVSVVSMSGMGVLAYLYLKKRKPDPFQPLATELEEVSVERMT